MLIVDNKTAHAQVIYTPKNQTQDIVECEIMEKESVSLNPEPRLSSAFQLQKIEVTRIASLEMICSTADTNHDGAYGIQCAADCSTSMKYQRC
jgi:hypothetical protein